jgi:catechol 2,3-dioxygenase-like lactoylglutathione lyase family enzyme
MISPHVVMRIARPTDNLAAITKMYVDGLGFDVLARFENHGGFDGVIIGHRRCAYHLEFTHHRGAVVGKAPTRDNLLVFYIAGTKEWDAACHCMEAAGFQCVASYNPYWEKTGKTFEDLDGYRVVLQNEGWQV